MSDLFARVVFMLCGLACVACEVWGTFDFLWDKHHHWNYLVVGGIVLTSLAAILPMAAEYAHRKGHRLLTWGAWIAIPVALAFVFTVSVQRTGTAADNDDVQRRQIAQSIKIAQAEQREAEDQLVIEKATVARNCGIWGPKCTKAREAQAASEAKLAAARAVLKTHGVEINDSMARPIVAYLPFLTREQVLLYQPLLQPMGLAIIGSLLMAIALRGGKRDDRSIEKTPPVHAQASARVTKPNVAVAPTEVAAPSEVELDPNPVVLFLKRKLAVARGVNADLAEIYEKFLQDWHAQGHKSEPLTAAQFGLVINYVCQQARIRMERRGKRVVCVDRKLIA
jgi:hypothetical protein